MYIDILYKILFSVMFGAAIGLERQLKGKAAGVRTTSLICVGTMLFVHIGSGLDGDKSRVLGQIISGVGFLGAGSIISKQGRVSGLTSAAVVWMVAAIGSTVGLGKFGLAAVITLTTIIILIGIQWIEFLTKKMKIIKRKQFRNNNKIPMI